MHISVPYLAIFLQCALASTIVAQLVGGSGSSPTGRPSSATRPAIPSGPALPTQPGGPAVLPKTITLPPKILPALPHPPVSLPSGTDPLLNLPWQVSKSSIADLFGRPRAEHTIEGPSIPPTVVIGFDSIAKNTDSDQTQDPIELALRQEFPDWNAQILNCYIKVKSRLPSRNNTITYGNGILINKNTILTALHVGRVVAEDTNSVIALYAPKDGGLFKALRFEKLIPLSDDSEVDICLLTVSGVETAPEVFPKIVNHNLAVKDRISMLGGMNFEAVPRLAVGNVTTSYGRRKLPTAPPIFRQCLGTSLISFEGLSGSPVFDCTTGNLIGVYVGGPKEYAKTTEQVVRAPESAKWELFTNWSWIVPISPFIDKIVIQANSKI